VTHTDRPDHKHLISLSPPVVQSNQLLFFSVPPMNFEKKMTKQNASEKSQIFMHCNDQGGISEIAI
jgi:hypothetical protein